MLEVECVQGDRACEDGGKLKRRLAGASRDGGWDGAANNDEGCEKVKWLIADEEKTV